MKADPQAQLKLLDLQAVDARLDQLRHQRRALPEIARIAELETGRGDVDDRLRDARIVVDDLTAEQRKADADVEQVKARRTQGEVQAPETEPGQAPLRFESKPARAPQQATDTANQRPIVHPRATPSAAATEGQP